MEKYYTESDTTIRFHESNFVIKFDEHRYYKYLSGHGMKGVDFMVIDKVFGLFLIELKNFRNPDTQPKDDQLTQNFYQKCDDSLRLIEVVYKVYQRKWWVKLLVNKLNMTFLLSEEDKAWLMAYNFYTEKKVMLLGSYEVF